MKVLITGGAGYIGFSLVEALSKRADVGEIVVFDSLVRRNYALFTQGSFDKSRIRFVQGELLDDRTLGKALKSVDTVYHLAAKVSTPYADQEAHSFDQVNHWGTAHLSRLAVEAGVSRFVHLSSASVYGSSTEIVNEHSVPNPASVYGVSKWRSEGQLERLHGKAGVFVIRAGNVYGFNPAFRIDAVINRFLFEARTSGRVTINGSGEQKRAFIHVAKLAEVLAGIIGSDLEPGVYNAVEHNLSIRELVGEIQKLVPDLEYLAVNQTMPMRNIRIETPCRLFNAIPLPQTEFSEELQEFLDRMGEFRAN